MALFSHRNITTINENSNGYYYQVFLEKPYYHKIPVNNKMWETEKDALYDLCYTSPAYIVRDNSDYDVLIIKDSSYLNKLIYITKIEKPDNMTLSSTKIIDIEKILLKYALVKYDIPFRVRIKNTYQQSNRGRVINLTYNSMKNNLKNTEYAKRCIDFVFNKDSYSYDKFIDCTTKSIIIANYNVFLGVPNPKTNTDKVDIFYKELNSVINNANIETIKYGYELKIVGNWDAGVIKLESLNSIYGESTIIYEADDEEKGATIKIDGKPVEDEEDEGSSDEDNYTIADEPDSSEDIPAEDEGSSDEDNYVVDTSDNDGDNTTEDNPPTEDEGSSDEDNYKIPDDVTTEDEPAPAENEGSSDEDNYVVDTSDSGDEPAPTEDTPVPAEDEGSSDEDNYVVDTSDSDGDNTTDGGGEDNATITDYSTEDETSEEGGEDETNLKTQEDDILSDMDPEHRRIQDEELKNNYIKLYNSINDIIVRVDKIPIDNNSSQPLSFVQKQLTDLKEYVYYYLSNVYSTKTYIENNINYEQYLLVLAGINNLIIQLNTKSSDIE